MKRICNLTWHSDLSAARADAARRARPILSLRLLGRLDEELSCANSRFFRATLYPAAEVAALLDARFTLHWQPLRPVPVVTIDFGDGRVLTRTLTGNSAHLVLDRHGRSVDVLPGLFDAGSFARLLAAAADLAQDTAALGGPTRAQRLARWHTSRAEAITRAWRADLVRIGLPPATIARTAPEDLAAITPWQRLAADYAHVALPDPDVRARLTDALRATPPSAGTRATDAHSAGALAPTKMMVERPLLDVLLPLARTIAEDTLLSQFELHRRAHLHLATSTVSDPDALTDWVYRDLFQMPPEDPWLGLRPDAFDALSGPRTPRL
ncbi:MAG: hypothetical protein IT370_30330 [Deltaproteobacteria bacterium]|nr:hypothetical protein [Deltaproteobacteria bacterium]